MKYLLSLILLFPFVSFAQPCADEDTVRNNAVTLITATTARVNGTTAHFSGSPLSIQLRYVRVGQTDTATASSAGTNPLRNISGLQAGTQYVYYYKTICGSGDNSQTIGPYTFTTLTSTVVYATERSTVFPYVKVDTGFTIPRLDTGSLYRAADIGGNIRFRPADSLPYYYNGEIWKVLAVDSAGILPALNLKVDSVTVAGDSLFYWVNGVSYGYILGTLASNWHTTGNASTSPGTNFLGTTDAQALWINTNGYNRLIVPSAGIASSTASTDSVLVTKTDGVTLGKIAKSALVTTPDLQAVTDVGNTTTNNLIVNSGGGTLTRQSGSAFEFKNTANNFEHNISVPTVTANRSAYLQDTTGTIAYLHDITTPTLQQVLTAGSTLDDTEQTIFGGGSNNSVLTFEDFNELSFTTNQGNNRRLLFNSTNGTITSEIIIKADSIQINPYLGNLKIDTLTSAVGTKALRYNPTSGLVSYADTTTAGSSLTAGYGILLPSTAIIADTSILVNKTGTQTLTNKTLTSPVINVTSDATGDMYYRDAGGLFTRLPIGTAGQHLVGGTIPAWRDTATGGGGGMAIGGSITSATAGSVLFAGTGGTLQQKNSDFFYDSTNASLNIGTNTNVASSILNLTSTTKGLLIPRMTLTQRNAIASPAAGLQVIVTGETGGEFLSFYNSSTAAWQRVVKLTSAGRLLLGTTSESTHILDVVGSTRLTGTGTNSTTFNLITQNSSAQNVFRVANNGLIRLGNATFEPPQIYAGAGSADIEGVSMTLIAGTAGGGGFVLNRSSNFSNCSAGGTFNHILSTIDWTQTNRDATVNHLNLTGSLNNALGKMRGILVNYTVTTGDFKAFQSTVGGAYVNTSTPAASAILQADATTQGLLIPRMTTVQRDAIASPATGLQVISTTDSTNYLYRGTTSGWQATLTGIRGSGTLDFGSIAHHSEEVLTISVTGAAEGDVVSLGIPNASNLTNVIFTAWVSAADTVSIKCSNLDQSAAKDPTSGTFKVTILKF